MYISNRHLNRSDAMIQTPDGTKEWCVNGKFHREDGPAVIYANGNEEWYFCGKLHRLDGPALVYRTWAATAWYINGVKCYSPADFQQRSGLSNEDITTLLLKYGKIK